jgi:hypothetical protein
MRIFQLLNTAASQDRTSCPRDILTAERFLDSRRLGASTAHAFGSGWASTAADAVRRSW